MFARFLFALALMSSIVANATANDPERTLTSASPFPAEDQTPSIPDRTDGGAPPRNGMGEGMGGGMGGMGGGAPGYDVTWYPSRTINGSAESFALVRQQLNVGVPVWKGDRGILLLTTSIRHSLIETEIRLPDSKRFFPSELWSVQIGMNLMHRFENGWSGGIITGLGSASDRPFATIDEFTATLGGFVRIPVLDDRDWWMLGLMYQYGGAINFPLPIISYVWNPNEHLRVNIGLPLSLDWRPSDEWQLALSYIPLLNINARLTRRFGAGWSAYAAYEFRNESYFLADRSDRRDRFFALEQRVLGGVRRDIGKTGTIDLYAGYSFGRSYGEGQSQWGTLRDEVRVAPGPFLGMRIGLRF